MLRACGDALEDEGYDVNSRENWRLAMQLFELSILPETSILTLAATNDQTINAPPYHRVQTRQSDLELNHRTRRTSQHGLTKKA